MISFKSSAKGAEEDGPGLHPIQLYAAAEVCGKYMIDSKLWPPSICLSGKTK
jgi:hypothetical protein